jgi:hypothetical protein
MPRPPPKGLLWTGLLCDGTALFDVLGPSLPNKKPHFLLLFHACACACPRLIRILLRNGEQENSSVCEEGPRAAVTLLFIRAPHPQPNAGHFLGDDPGPWFGVPAGAQPVPSVSMPRNASYPEAGGPPVFRTSSLGGGRTLNGHLPPQQMAQQPEPQQVRGGLAAYRPACFRSAEGEGGFCFSSAPWALGSSGSLLLGRSRLWAVFALTKHRRNETQSLAVASAQGGNLFLLCAASEQGGNLSLLCCRDERVGHGAFVLPC